MDVRIIQIAFEDVLPIWTRHLWPSPKKTIRPASSLKFMGGWDLGIHEQTATFLGAEADGRLIGVISGFTTAPDLYRCRGLWVDPDHRGHGLAQRLLEAISLQALSEERGVLWSLPRQSIFPVYSKFGFIQRSEWLTEGMDFGPNCYASVELSSRSRAAEMQTRLTKRSL